MLILKRVLIPMIKAPLGIVWTLVGAATPFSTCSLTRPHAWRHGASGFPCSRGAGKRVRPRWFENHVRHPTRCRPLLIATSATSGIAAGAYDGECLPVRAIRVPLGRREYTCVGIEARLSLAIVRRVGAVSAEEVDEYLRGFDEPKRSALQTLRRTILEIVP